MALHCCLNGPVGVHKITKIPTLEGDFSINNVAYCTNNNWRDFVNVGALELNNKDSIKNCYTYKTYGSLWPICDLQ